MNSKFIRVLIIINGILIPVFIVFVLGSVFFDKYENRRIDKTDLETYEKNKNIYEIKYSSPNKIPNSDNHYVAVSRKFSSEYDFDTEDDLLNLIPDNTVNLLFLDKDFNITGKILDKEGSILNMFIPNRLSDDENLISQINNLSFFIAKEDTNNDGRINRNDQHYVYVSDLDGKNLTRVTDRKVKQYQWINNNKEILLTFDNGNETETLEYGIYNIENKKIKGTKSLNPRE